MKSLYYNIPRKGEIIKVADDLYWARFELPFRLNHINIYFIESKDGWIVIDCGINDENTKDHWNRLFKESINKNLINKIIVTHHHPDHIGFSNQLVIDTSADIYISQGEKENAEWLMNTNPKKLLNLIVKAYQSYDISKDDINLLKKRGSKYKDRVQKLPDFKIIKEGEKIKSKYGVWETRLDTGHSSSHLSLVDRDRKLYLSADFLLPRISPNVSADLRDINLDRLGSYLKYLNEMSNLADDFRIFPGHDWPFKNGGKRAIELIKHHKKRLNQLLKAAKNEPLTVNSSIDVLFRRKFEEHELFFASGEARAHLNHLVSKNKLHKFKDVNDVDYYKIV